MKHKLLLTLTAVLFTTASLLAQVNKYDRGLQQYTLDNGLTVYLWEDPNANMVTGYAVFRAGAVDEPAEYTGLAHYLEHMLFKGTQKIGALDWEKEKPLYEEVIRLYNELNAETDVKKREELIKKINEVSLEEAKLSATNDFSNLTESYGGVGLNAYTSYDETVYHNSFPASAMYKWLELNSERLINPVFRSFQAELENVYEEFNMGTDNIQRAQGDIRFKHIYKGCPYERSVIGFQDHLKNPSLSALINFYETWYVANNMALILVGNFDAEATKPMIEKTFGRLPSKTLPERPTYQSTDYSKNPTIKEKIGQQPMAHWIFKGPKYGDPDEVALDFTLSLLNNQHNTGLLDRLMLDGEIGAAQCMGDARRIDGRVWVIGVPYFDPQTRMYETTSQTRKLIFKEIDKLKNEATIPNWLFESVKNMEIQSNTTMFESVGTKTELLKDVFLNHRDPRYYLDYDKAIAAITKEDVVRCANKYLAGDHLTLEFTEGEPKKNKLAKPAIKPLEYPKNVETEYAKEFNKLPTTPVEPTFANLNDVEVRQLYNNVNMHYSKNTQNNVFNLTLRYGVGAREMPKLEYAAYLMNMAGMMPNIDAQSMHRKYSELGVAYSFSASDDYFYINLSGDEANLEAALALMSQHVMMPNLDDQQVKSMIANEAFGRIWEKKSSSTVASALLQYVLYGDKSPYIDRIAMDDLYSYSIVGDVVVEKYIVNKTNLTTTIQEATGYALDAFYCGQRSADDVATALNAMPMQANMKNSNSPYYKPRQTYDKTQVIFLPDSKMQQAKIYFYLNSNPYDIKDEALYDAFNQYFDGGFSGLVMNEIREKRSMAYTATGSLSTPSFPGKDAYMLGYIGTQGDKVADAIDVFMGLVNEMPDNPDRIGNIQEYLSQIYINSKPSMRSKAGTYEYWKRMGYTEDPSKMALESISKMTYDDIKAFYNANVKDKPMTIVVIGDPKSINLKQIKAKYGKEQRISPSKLFKGGI